MKKNSHITPNSDTKNYLRANQKQNFQSQRHNEQRELVYVAPDACILIDIEKMKTSRISKAVPEYMHSLNLLLRLSKARIGDRFANGSVVMMLMPATQEELSNYHGKYHEVIEKILNKHVLIAEIDEHYHSQFQQLENTLVKAYRDRGLFSPNQTMDAKLVAEASIFNIPVISRDNHIVGKENDKIGKIREVNESILGTYQHQAFPIKIKTFVSRVLKNNPSPAPDNFVYLSKNTQKTLKQMNNGKVKIGFHDYKNRV